MLLPLGSRIWAGIKRQVRNQQGALHLTLCDWQVVGVAEAPTCRAIYRAEGTDNDHSFITRSLSGFCSWVSRRICYAGVHRASSDCDRCFTTRVHQVHCRDRAHRPRGAWTVSMGVKCRNIESDSRKGARLRAWQVTNQ